MNKMKKLLLTLLALAICLPAAAMATVDFPTVSLPESWEGRVFKLTLESGYWLDVSDNNKFIEEIVFEDIMGAYNVPIYDVEVPSGTEYVYMYMPQSEMDNGDYAFVIGDSAYAAKAAYTEGVPVELGSSNSALSKLETTDVNICAPDYANDDEPYSQTLKKVKVPVTFNDADGVIDVLLFENCSYQIEFALHFMESNLDVSNVPVESMELSGNSVWRADEAGKETLEIKAYVHPVGATNVDQIQWECSDDTIAIISDTQAIENGDVDDDHLPVSLVKLSPKAVGTFTITATCGDASASFTVNLKSVPVIEPTVDAVALDQTEAELWKFADGETIPTGYEAYADSFASTLTLTATASAEGETVEDAEIAWTSSDETVATVEDGVVTAVGAGEATITASVGDVKAECAVKVSDFVAPGYTNVSIGDEWKTAENQPEAVVMKILDLSDENQPHSFTIHGSAYKNVNSVKTLSSIQAMTWNVTDKNGCVTYTDDGNGNLTVTCTGQTGVVTFQPVLLNGYKNVSLPLYITNGFVSEASIVRADGKDWVYDETVTINKVEHPVFVMEQGDEVSLSAKTDVEITHDYDGWMWNRLDESDGTYATIQVKGENGAEYDLSTLKVGLYRILARVPMYEQNYIIDPLGMNKQDTVRSEWLYIRVKEKTVVSGDVSGDGIVNASDAVLVLQYAAQSATLTDEQIAAADMNDDGKVDANDAVLILQKIAE